MHRAHRFAALTRGDTHVLDESPSPHTGHVTACTGHVTASTQRGRAHTEEPPSSSWGCRHFSSSRRCIHGLRFARAANFTRLLQGERHAEGVIVFAGDRVGTASWISGLRSSHSLFRGDQLKRFGHSAKITSFCIHHTSIPGRTGQQDTHPVTHCAIQAKLVTSMWPTRSSPGKAITGLSGPTKSCGTPVRGGGTPPGPATVAARPTSGSTSRRTRSPRAPARVGEGRARPRGPWASSFQSPDTRYRSRCSGGRRPVAPL